MQEWQRHRLYGEIRREVMAGARDEERERALRRLLLRFDLLAFDTAADFDAVARIYRRCRREGVTPRGWWTAS